MTTLLLQWIVSASAAALAVVALMIARTAQSSPPARTAAWGVVGVGFLVIGLNGLVHNAFATWAFSAGPNTGVYDAFLRWSGAGNFSRSLWVVGVFSLLAIQGWTGRQLASLRLWGAMLVASTLAAALIHIQFGTSEVGQYTVLAVFETVEMVIALLATGVLIFRDAADRLLVGLLCVFGLRQALSGLWTAAFTWLEQSNAWCPSCGSLKIMGLILYSAMIALAVYRLILARRGVYVPALIETKQTPNFSVFS
jgi:hypothetical protein